jgi:hypothetical protein
MQPMPHNDNDREPDGSSVPCLDDIRQRLNTLITDLDLAGEAVAAAYVQMAIDTLRLG